MFMCLWKNSNFLCIKEARSLSLRHSSAPTANAEMMEESLMAEVVMAMTPGLTTGIREEFACLACL